MESKTRTRLSTRWFYKLSDCDSFGQSLYPFRILAESLERGSEIELTFPAKFTAIGTQTWTGTASDLFLLLHDDWQPIRDVSGAFFAKFAQVWYLETSRWCFVDLSEGIVWSGTTRKAWTFTGSLKRLFRSFEKISLTVACVFAFAMIVQPVSSLPIDRSTGNNRSSELYRHSLFGNLVAIFLASIIPFAAHVSVRYGQSHARMWGAAMSFTGLLWPILRTDPALPLTASLGYVEVKSNLQVRHRTHSRSPESS